MRCSLIIFSSILLICSCKNSKDNQQEKLIGNLKTYFRANFMDSTENLDSLRILKIDSLNKIQILGEQNTVLGNSFDHLMELYKLNLKSMTNDAEEIALLRNMGDQTLLDIQYKDLDNDKEQGKLMKIQLDTLIKIMNDIGEKMKKVDTTKKVGFQLKCFYQIRQKDKSVKRDTVYLFLNENKDIISREDLIKVPYTVDFDKFQ